MKDCKECSSIYRKPGTTVSKCGKKFETKISVETTGEFYETIKDKIKNNPSRYSKKIKQDFEIETEIEATQEENTNE